MKRSTMLPRFPRRMRLKWVVFLLAVCFVGLYFTYKQLVESKQMSTPNMHAIDRLSYQRLNQQNKPNLQWKRPVVDSRKGIGENDIHPAAQLIRNLEADSDYITSEEKNMRLKLLLNNLSPTNWKTALDAGDMMSVVKTEIMDMDLVSKLSCREIDALKLGSAHRSGFYGKKAVDFVMLAYPNELAVKSVGNDHALKIECMKQDYNADRCTNMANYKVMRELVYLLALENASIIEMKGYCLRGETIDPRVNMKGAIIVTEGSRQLPESFHSHCWSCRLEVVLELLQLLVYMDNSPLGNLGFEQLHSNDFVLVGTKVKLVDLDNIRVWEKPCETDKDCTIEEMPRKEIKCVESECKGRNSLNNLLWLSRSVLGLILNFPPVNEAREVERMLENIQNLKMTINDVIQQVKKMLEKADPNSHLIDNKDEIKGGLTIVDLGAERSQNRVAPGNEVKVVHDDDTRDKVKEVDVQKDELESNRVIPKNNQPITSRPVQTRAVKQDVPETKHDYERHDSANFPGLFDYTCSIASRVTWGCVVSVTSLEDAKSFCNRDPHCEAFVVFSSNPEIDALMTMVMKNSANGTPSPNFGATLFIKKSPLIPDASPTAMSPAACKVRAQNQTEKARLSRERRLMTHIGLKGIAENRWKNYASVVTIVKVFGRTQLMHNTTVGGRFKLQFEKNSLGITKGEFIAEAGPLQYHVGYIITYFVDRILGLYHTPPAIVRKLRLGEIQAMKGDKSWLSRMTKFNQSDGSGIQGVLTLPVPPVMKTSRITITMREKMDSNLPSFSRDEKVQLEYILLMSLTKMLLPQHGYLGYKGHLIHFEADTAFQNAKQSLQGYFYNCQFPNAVYKTLVCYKCPGSTSRVTQICGLGEQAISSAINLGLKDEDIKIGSFSSTDLKDIINNSAAAILTVVEHCIRTNSREKVLY